MLEDVDFNLFQPLLERQDNKGEIALSDLCGLRRNTNRMAAEDAFDEIPRGYQLKASTKSGFSTVRDFRPSTIVQWRHLYFIMGYGRNFTDRFIVDEVYFMAPCHLYQWLCKQEAWFRPRLQLRDELIARCRGMSHDSLSEMIRIFDNGLNRNDPNISRGYVVQHGILVEQNHPEEIRRLADKYPIDMLPTQSMLEYDGVFV